MADPVVVLNGNSYSFQSDFTNRGHLTAFPNALRDWLQDAGKAPYSASASVVEVGTGAKAFDLLVPRPFAVGGWVMCASAAAPGAQWMYGQILAYDGVTLSVDVQIKVGSGSASDWVVSIAAPLPEISVDVQEALGAAVRAEAAADVAALNAGIFDDTTDGLAGTSEGDYFSVPSGDGTEYLILYRHDPGGVATEKKRYPATGAVAAVAATLANNPLLNNVQPVTGTVDTLTVLSPHTVRVTDDGVGDSRVYWACGEALDEGDVVRVLVSASPANVTWALRTYDGSAFSTYGSPVIADGRLHRYDVVVPAGGTQGFALQVAETSGGYENVELTLMVLPGEPLSEASPASGLSPLLGRLLIDRDEAPPMGPVNVTGKIVAYDGIDGIVARGGRVAAWTSDDGLSTMVQATASRQPLRAAGGPYFRSGSLARTSASRLVRIEQLPDGLVAPNPGGGFTCTGFTRDNRLLPIMAGDGREQDIGGADHRPSIVTLTPDYRRVVSDVEMTGALGNGSIQGIAWASDNTIWGAYKPKGGSTGSIFRTNRAGALQSGGFNLSYRPNGLAINEAAGHLYVARDASATIEVRSIAAGDLVSTITAPNADIDHLHWDGSFLWLTTGANGSPGVVICMTLAGKEVRRFTIPHAEAIEGVFVDGNRILVNSDGAFHLQAKPPLALMIEHEIDAVPANCCPSSLLWAGALRLGLRPTRTAALFEAGDPLGAAGGFGLYFLQDADTLRFICRNVGGSASAATVDWPVSARNSDRILAVQVVDGTSIAAYVDGVLVSPSASTGALSAYTRGLSVATYRICDALDNTRPLDALLHGWLMASSLTDRVKAEGWLAHRYGLTRLLASAHTWKRGRPT